MYAVPLSRLLPIAFSCLRNQSRSFQQDAVQLIRSVRPAPLVLGLPPEFSRPGLVVAVNHYHRPGFGAWWIALCLAASLPTRMHWMMTSAWVYPDRWRSWTITPLSRRVLVRLARCYGFTSTPPMPPRPQDFSARAAALRSLLRALGSMERPVLGIAPEGADAAGGVLQSPADGVDHLFHLLWKRGMHFVPVGVYEHDGRLTARFGERLDLPDPSGGPEPGRDSILEYVMRGIAACLPLKLRGDFA